MGVSLKILDFKNPTVWDQFSLWCEYAVTWIKNPTASSHNYQVFSDIIKNIGSYYAAIRTAETYSSNFNQAYQVKAKYFDSSRITFNIQKSRKYLDSDEKDFAQTIAYVLLKQFVELSAKDLSCSAVEEKANLRQISYVVSYPSKNRLIGLDQTNQNTVYRLDSFPNGKPKDMKSWNAIKNEDGELIGWQRKKPTRRFWFF
ncbi:MAG: hypothetical protein JXA94_04405 [Parachlamydiales bacterium]|nr:hypothetical protein [Parachlamydiales bacterium]